MNQFRKYLTDAAAGLAYKDLKRPYSVGHRAGYQDGYEVRDGRVWRHQAAGYADGKYPYGSAVIDWTAECEAKAASIERREEFRKQWEAAHPVLAGILNECPQGGDNMTRDGFRRVRFLGPSWEIAKRLRQAGYSCTFEKNPLCDCGFTVSARKIDA